MTGSSSFIRQLTVVMDKLSLTKCFSLVFQKEILLKLKMKLSYDPQYIFTIKVGNS